MRLATTAAALLVPALAGLARPAAAIVLTYSLPAGASECFYAITTKPDQKLAFYYAVQSGGDFDLDYHALDPKGDVIFNGYRERNIDLVLTGYELGEYTFCLENTGASSSADKVVDFEVLVEGDDVQASMPLKHPLDAEKQSNMQESIFRMLATVGNIERTMKYFHTRESRNMATVRSTENRVFWFAVLQSTIIVGMAVAQVYVIRAFFASRGGGRL